MTKVDSGNVIQLLILSPLSKKYLSKPQNYIYICERERVCKSMSLMKTHNNETLNLT